MSETDKPGDGGTAPPKLSRKKLVTYFGAAYLGAALLLVAAVLPAEYGIDPLGIGKVTGLNKLSEQREVNAREALANRDKVTEGVAFLQTTPFKTETLEIQIEDLGEVEHKLIMSAGDVVTYSWQVQGDIESDGVYFEFHGHPPSKNTDYPRGFSQSYDKGEKSESHGGFTAPFDGYFGWYFMNLEERAITIRVDVSGYWDKDIELYRAVEGNVVTAIDY